MRQHNEAVMKADPRAACGQPPRPANSQTNRRLPFCGLGAEDSLKNHAVHCGMLQLAPRAPHTGEFSDTVLER